MPGPISEATLSPASPASRALRSRHPSPLVRWMRRLVLPLTVLALVPLVFTELGYFSIRDLVGSTISDVVYLSHGAFGLTAGHVPYTTGFMTAPDQHLAFLYPPLTLVLLMPAALAGSHFTAGFSIEILLLVVLGVVLLGRAARRSGLTFPVGLGVFVLVIALGPTTLTRVDAVQGLLVAGAALALSRRRERTAVVLVAAAVLIKETAVLAAMPVVLWCLWPKAGEPVGTALRRGAVNVLIGGAPALALFLGFLIWSGGGEVTSALTSVHRGLEVESLPAFLAICLSWLVPVHQYFGHLASYQIRASDAGLLAGVVSALGALAVVVGSVRFCRLQRRPATMVAFAVAAGLCTTPVLSPQYLLDLLPVLVVAAVVENSGPARDRLLLIALAVALLTQVEFPYLFAPVIKLAPVGLVPLFARNVLLVLLAVLLGRGARSGSRVPQPSAEPLLV